MTTPERENVVSERIMKQMKYIRFWFWGLIIFGASIPILVGLTTELLYNPELGLRFYMGDIFIGPLNAIPFIILAFLVKYIWLDPKIQSSPNLFQHKSGIICAGIFTICFNLYINIDVWKGIALNLSGSSTAVIIYVFLPIYGVITILVGYGIGILAGKIIIRVKNRGSKS